MIISIGQRDIGEDKPCYIVAEIGLNHNGSVDVARDLIDKAARVGIDAVKLQKRSITDVLTHEHLQQPYSGPNSYGTTYGQHRAALELSEVAWCELCDHSVSVGVQFFASPWDIKSADFLADLDIPAFKVASGDVTNLPLLRHIARKGKPVILSTGMCTLDEVDEAVAVVSQHNDRIVVLHCVSTYPFDVELANLRMIPVFVRRYPHAVIGYSGHEKSGHIISVAAVVLGAKLIERHLTLDRTMRGPDHAASLEPRGFEYLIENVRKVEVALGTGEKCILDSEVPIRAKLAKSVVSSCDIPAGTVITVDMLTVKSPGTGIMPKDLDNICGRIAQVDVPDDTLLPMDAMDWIMANERAADG